MKAIYLCIILGFLISDSRQNNLERHIQCPCNKGLLINHGTPIAMKLKELISFLIEDSIDMNSVKTFIKKTRFINDDKNTQNDENLDHQVCLISNVDKNISNNKISDSGVYNIVGNCYGQHLIKNKSNNYLLYIILLIIIGIGGIFSYSFIAKNKKRGL